MRTVGHVDGDQSMCYLTLYDSCKILPKTPKKGIPKVNCMLFLGHLDDMHGVGLL